MFSLCFIQDLVQDLSFKNSTNPLLFHDPYSLRKVNNCASVLFFFFFKELDMTSTFVSKAALIARRKLEQKPRPEWREKKKSLVKEPKTIPDKPNEDPEIEEKVSCI